MGRSGDAHCCLRAWLVTMTYVSYTYPRADHARGLAPWDASDTRPGDRPMQTRQIIGTLVLLLLALPHPLWAQSLETRKMRAEQEAALGTQVALTNTKCGTNMTARI